MASLRSARIAAPIAASVVGCIAIAGVTAARAPAAASRCAIC